MLRKELLRKEVSRRLSCRLGLTITVELVLGLLLSVGVIWLFAQIVEEVIDGESRRFDEAALLWINDNFPAWFDVPMLLATALGYYLVILPLLVVVTYAFYRKGAKISATLLPVATLGSMILTEVLKRIFQRARPELFDSGYYASGYSFPSGHATLAVGFYGTLVLLLAWRLEGFWRWAVVVAGVALVLLIGLSRMYFGAHYPTDVLAGFLAAPLWVSAVGLSYLLWRTVRGPREDADQPGVETSPGDDNFPG